MVSAVSFSSTGIGATTASDAGSSVALQDRLARCVKQLGDWQGCPSGKTPEGQKIIQNLRSQIDNIQSRINQSKQAVATQETPVNVHAGVPVGGSSTGLGGSLNVYA